MFERLTRGGRAWPGPDKTTAALVAHCALSAASGGTPEQALADVHRVLTDSPSVLDGYFELVERATGRDKKLDERVRRLRRELLRAPDGLPSIRPVALALAALLQLAFVARTCPPDVEDAYVRTRLGEPSAPLGHALSATAQGALIERTV